MFKRADIILISVVMILAVIVFGFVRLTESNENLTAHVNHRGSIVLEIDLSQLDETPTYHIVIGDNGPLRIYVKRNSIRIQEINCTHHHCMSHGWVRSSIRMIVCLPNGISIRLISNELSWGAVV